MSNCKPIKYFEGAEQKIPYRRSIVNNSSLWWDCHKKNSKFDSKFLFFDALVLHQFILAFPSTWLNFMNLKFAPLQYWRLGWCHHHYQKLERERERARASESERERERVRERERERESSRKEESESCVKWSKTRHKTKRRRRRGSCWRGLRLRTLSQSWSSKCSLMQFNDWGRLQRGKRDSD